MTKQTIKQKHASNWQNGIEFVMESKISFHIS